MLELDSWSDLPSVLWNYEFEEHTLSYLSVCFSSSGHFISGESPMSTAPAFQAVEAPSVIATLWTVSDVVSANSLRFLTTSYAREVSYLQRPWFQQRTVCKRILSLTIGIIGLLMSRSDVTFHFFLINKKQQSSKNIVLCSSCNQFLNYQFYW